MEKPELRIALVGKVGVGKSASVSTILGGNHTLSSATERQVGHFKLKVVDTPGLFGTSKKHEDVMEEIDRCFSICTPGPHVFLVVINLNNFSEKDEQTVKMLQNMFGPEVDNYMMALITHGDELKKAGIPLEKRLHEKPVCEFITHFKGSYHVFDNTVKDESQVEKLVEKIAMFQNNGVTYCTLDVFEEADGTMEVDKKRLKKESPAMGDKPVRSKADELCAVAATLGLKQNELRIVLIGRTAVGKSATGNTILGRKAFTSRLCFLTLTKKCAKETREFGGFKLAVVDTPGLCDPRKKEDMAKEMNRCISLCAPGPHVFLVVITPRSFTKEEEEPVTMLQNMFGPEVKKHIMVIISHGDELKRSGVSMEDLLHECEPVREFITQCKGGYHVFDNTVEDQSQVQKLVEKINRMLEKNTGDYFTHDAFKTAEKAIEAEMEHLRKTKPGISDEQARSKAEEENSIVQGWEVFDSTCGSDHHNDLSVVLLGQERVGKSSAGNTILGQNVFDNRFSMRPLTLKSQMSEANVLRRRVSVVDTPGLVSSLLSEEQVKAELKRALELSSPGPHAFLLTIQLGRFTEQDHKGLEMLEKFLGPAVVKRTIVLFTYGDRLVNMSIKDFVLMDQNLQELLNNCSGQYQLFNNMEEENRDQVEELLRKVEEVSRGGRYVSQSQSQAMNCNVC